MSLLSNPITNTLELATELSRLSKLATRRRDSYFLTSSGTFTLSTLVRHASSRGISIHLWKKDTNVEHVICGTESMTETMVRLVEELRASFITCKSYMAWMRENGIKPNLVCMWKKGKSTPRLSAFIQIAVEELGYELTLRKDITE